MAYALLEVSRWLADVVYIPRVGYVVNDAEIARQVLTDSEYFGSHSPGSLGVLISQVLGPYALLNMDGPAHADLKRRMLDVFSTKYVKTLIDAATHEIVLDLRRELLAGQQVDLVAFMQHFARRMAC